MMNSASIYTLSQNKGAPRIYLDGKKPIRSGFTPGAHFEVEKTEKSVILRLKNEVTKNKVSKKEKSGQTIPVIDINSAQALEPLIGSTVVRVLFGPDCIVISRVGTESRLLERLKRLKRTFEQDQPVSTGGVAAGAGVLAHAAHQGFKDAGLKTRVAFHNEIREDLAEHALRVNDALDDRTQILNMPLQEMAFDPEVSSRIEPVIALELGLPCSGASVAGRAKRHLGIPEEHPDVGHLVVGALALIARVNPVVCVFENVPQYANTASAVLLRNQLRDFGYEVKEREFFGPDFGALEARRRWCMVAMTQGIEFDLDQVTPGIYPKLTVADILDSAEKVEHKWSKMEGLKAKEIRDIEDGKGFRMQLYSGEESKISTLTKGLAKNRSTDPKIVHPTNSELLRIPTAAEHARCKGVPEHLIDGLSETTAHEMLGQGVVYEPFRALFEYIGNVLEKWAVQGEVKLTGREVKFAA